MAGNYVFMDQSYFSSVMRPVRMKGYL